MLWFFRYTGGYLTVVFYGEFPEKILNLTSANKIYLWDSKLTKKGIECCISVKDFRKMLFILKNSGVKVHILKKHGLPFKTEKNRKRLGLAVGMAVFFIFLKIMSGYVWIIDVTGNKTVDSKEIISALEDIGIKEGIRTKSINSKIQKEKLLLQIDSLAWASLNIEGCRLTVNVSEIKDEKNEETSACNLTASADGIKKKIYVTTGNCVVKPGDTVKTGDVLVSGILERQSGTEFVRSQGSIIAVTERSINVKGNFTQQITSENGSNKTKTVLDLFTLKIPLYLGKETQKYNSVQKTVNLSLFGQTLPIRIHQKKFCYVDDYTITYSREKLTEKLEKQIEDKIKEEGIETYTEISRNINETEDQLEITVIISAEENIAVSEELLVSPQ